MKKKLTAILLTGVLTFSLIGTAMATHRQPVPNSPTSNSTTGIAPRAEQTKWYYQSVNGQIQKRLWSITKGVWLTDWANV